MNIVHFFTDLTFCEQSPYTPTCRDWKQVLLELNVNYVTRDLRKEKQSTRELLSIMGPTASTPHILIKNGNNNITHFGPQDINPIIESLNLTFSTREEYLSTLKQVIQDKLVEYGAL